MANFKITTKTTRNTLENLLKLNAKLVSDDKSLADRVKYTIDHADKATRSDLADMVKEVIDKLGDKFLTGAPAPVAVAENSLKKPVKVAAKKAAPKKEEPVEEEDDEEEEQPEEVDEKPVKAKKSAPTKTKKVEKKADGVKELESATDSPKSLQLAKMFPETIEVEGEKFKVAHDIKKIGDLADGEYEFAFYWTKRHLRQFPYFNDWLGHPKSFPNDLDTAQLIYVSDDEKVAYCVSDITEGSYAIFPNDLEEIDGLRLSGGIEFQIYRKVEDEPEEEDEPVEEKPKAKKPAAKKTK